MSADAVGIKGWCPGARRPMQSGDGLIVRVRPHVGSLPVAALAPLADAAARFGNGQIDLTRRANLQIRGVRPETLAALWELLASLGLLDASAEEEAIRNIAVNPLAGFDPDEILDMRPVAAVLERLLVGDAALRALPGKFGISCDGGGALPLSGLDADIRLTARHADGGAVIAIGLATADGPQWLGTSTAARAAGHAIRLAHAILAQSPTGRAHALPRSAPVSIASQLGLDACVGAARMPDTAAQRRGLIRFAGGWSAVGLGAPFGRIDAAGLATLADALTRLCVTEIRLSPWRTLYVALPEESGAAALLEMAAALGLIVDDADPLVRIDACSGAGCCRSTEMRTRDHARALAGLAARAGFGGTIHVSGCPKGCARSSPADVVLVGDGGRYRVIRDGTVRDRDCGMLAPEQILSEDCDILRQDWNAHV